MRMRILGMTAAVLLGVSAVVLGQSAAAPGDARPAPVTFAKDVAPILYKNCVECHRPSMFAPMSLMTYEEARPWARSIKQRVVKREMPPWSADPAHGLFKNDPRLSQDEIDTIAAWVDGGRAERQRHATCRRADASPRAGRSATPDAVFTMTEEFKVPADGTIPYRTSRFRPTSPKTSGSRPSRSDRAIARVVHHVIAYDAACGRNRATNGQPARHAELGGTTPNKPGVSV